MSRRLLVLTYYYPPMVSVGVNRWLAMAKYLRRRGHEVTILTTDAYGVGPADDAEGAVRAGDLTSSRLLRSLLRRPALPVHAGAIAGAAEKPAPRMLANIVPDAGVIAWGPGAIAKTRRLVRDRRIECVVTTSPPESVHLVPLALPSRPAWLADLRDGWRFESTRDEFPTRFQRRLDAWLEKTVVAHADRVVAAVEPIADDLRARLGIHPAFVPSGWDDELLDRDAASPVELDPACVNVVSTGKLIGPRTRHPGPLFAAIERLKGTAEGERLRLILAGRLDTAEEALLASLDTDGMVQHVGELSRSQALALQRQADALLLLTSPGPVSELSGKIFEYFGARRPILALAKGNEAARMVEETHTGRSVPADDVTAIAEALKAAARGELADAYQPTGLERYTYPVPAEQMEAEIERAIAARKRRG